MEEGLLMSEQNSKVSTEALHGYRTDSAAKRLAICNACPLYMREMQVCNPNLWLNVETNETSRRARHGYARGCGCLIAKKARQKSSHCHLGKW